MRFPDWTHRFRAAVEARAAAEFAYGTFDCCLAAADVIAAMTGRDPAVEFRGYSSAQGAAAKLRQWAPPGTPRAQRLEKVAERLAGEQKFAEIPVKRAQRGDVVLLAVMSAAGRIEDAIGFVDLCGTDVLVPGARGWIRLPLEQARRAWRVG